MKEQWEREELEAAVLAYRSMQKCEETHTRYSKKTIYEVLAAQFGRSIRAYEYRMQNISSVLHELGEPWLKGLPPARNIGVNVATTLSALVREHPISGASHPISYEEKVPAMREWLVQLAKAERTVNYGDVMAVFDVGRFNLKRAMDMLGHEAASRNEPILTALIVSRLLKIAETPMAIHHL